MKWEAAIKLFKDSKSFDVNTALAYFQMLDETLIPASVVADLLEIVKRNEDDAKLLINFNPTPRIGWDAFFYGDFRISSSSITPTDIPCSKCGSQNIVTISGYWYALDSKTCQKCGHTWYKDKGK